ncbi:MAG TPA: FHA domain-containing protein [Herpetosiphonaceae bacterium]
MDYGWLQIYHRGGLQQDLPLRDELTIGRADDNDVVLNEATVSPYHAKIVCDSEGCWIVDLTSANGTFVEGERLASQQPQVLTEGVTVQIGNTRIIAYPQIAGASDATQPSGPNAPTLAVPAIVAPFNRGAPPAEGVPTGNPFAQSGLTAPSPMRAVPAGEFGLHTASSTGHSSVNLTLTASDLAAHAGGSAFTSIFVVNRSTVVNRIELVVDGVPPSWVTIKPNTLSLFPGGQGEAQILINPPRDPSSRAGTHTFEVIARSEQHPAERPVVAGTLTILPFSEFALDINPQQQTARVQGTYEIQVANRSNSERVFQFEGREAENAITFRFHPATLKVGPGETGTVRTRARLIALHWVGSPKIYPFTVNVAPNDQSAPHQQVGGRLVHRPPISPQLLMFLMPLLMAACSGMWYLYRYNKPRIVAALMPSATPTPSMTTTATIFSTDSALTLTQTVTATGTEIVPTLEPTLVPTDPGAGLVPIADPTAPSPAASPTTPPTATPNPTATGTATGTATPPPTATPNPTATQAPTSTPTIGVATALPTTFIAPTLPPLPTPTPTNTPTPSVTPTPLPLVVEAIAQAQANPSSSRRCQETFGFSGTIRVNGPVTVKYHWTRSDGSMSPDATYTFTSAGSYPVSNSWNVSVSQSTSGWARLDVIEPVAVSSGQSNFTLTCDMPYAAYVYNNDTTSGSSFSQLIIDSVQVDVVSQSAVAAHPNRARWMSVIVGNDTSWSSANVGSVWDLNKPIIGVGMGGRSFFKAAAAVAPSLELDNSDWQASGKDVIAANRQDTFMWQSIDTNAVVPLYTADTSLVGMYSPQPKLGLIRVGQKTDSTPYYPIAAQEVNGACHKLWGFTGAPTSMTDQGKQLFKNAFFKSSCPASITKVTLTISQVYCSQPLESPPIGNGDEVFFTLQGSPANAQGTAASTSVQGGVVRGYTYAPSMSPITFTDPGSSLTINVQGEDRDLAPEQNDGNNSLISPGAITITRAELEASFGTSMVRDFQLTGTNGTGVYRVSVTIVVE